MRVTINGTAHDVHVRRIAHDVVALFAGVATPARVTWRSGDAEGTLAPGERIAVTEGLAFDVVPTRDA